MTFSPWNATWENEAYMKLKKKVVAASIFKEKIIAMNFASLMHFIL